MLSTLVALYATRQGPASGTRTYIPTSLPEAAEPKWTYVGPTPDPAFVLNKILFVRNERGQDLGWFRNDLPLDFTTKGNSFVLDLKIKINSGGWLNNLSGLENWRTSFFVFLTDSKGYGVALGLGEHQVRLTDDLDNATSSRSTDFLPYYAAGGFHTYRLSIKDSKCNFYIESKFVKTLKITGTTKNGLETLNRVMFSNYSLLTSDICITSLKYTQQG